jgi:hypothetical protein
VSAVEKNYLRVAIVWVITLAALYAFQWHFTH